MRKQIIRRTYQFLAFGIFLALMVSLGETDLRRSEQNLLADDASKKSGEPKSAQKKLAERINLKDADGKRVFEIKPESNGAKLVGADDKEIARYTASDHTLKIKDAADKVLGHIVRQEDHYKVEDADRKNVLFKIAVKSNGDWSVEDGKQERLYRIKKRDYGQKRK